MTTRTSHATAHHGHHHCRRCRQAPQPVQSLSRPQWPRRPRTMLGNAAFRDFELTWRGGRHSHRCPQAANQRPPGTRAANLIGPPSSTPQASPVMETADPSPDHLGGSLVASFTRKTNCQGESKACPSSGSLQGWLELEPPAGG